MPPHASRRSVLFGGAGLVASLGLAACSSGSGGSGSGAKSAAGGGSSTQAGAASGFPVPVPHKYGTTVVRKAPVRIVSDGYTDHDAALALGVVPLGLRQWIPQWKQGVGPWAVSRLQGQQPKIWADTGVPFEKIAALAPDLVLEIGSGLTQGDYTKLSQIAPTIAQAKGYVDYGTPWDVGSLMVGEALGRKAEMQSLIDGVNARFAAARRAHPGLAGKTVNVMGYSGAGSYYVYSSEDTRGRFYGSLGCRTPAAVDKAAGNQFYAQISQEQADLLEADLLVVLGDQDSGSRKVFDKDQVLQRLDAVKQGRFLFLDDLDVTMALSASTVLSLPYAIDKVVPQSTAALKV
ncbi:ABC transporter substrate-binding protein [Streptacidiphilus sp. P02-A3a]|uniref:ABC transporter substrate-binding protein n=1 Tax=Streptacidiphilus sp. P02-A3a TaxID=2704468 RepID=UPI0015F8B977|nr:ABC transporter substrate-binding protein [Streptacidiphilus sp. P02-A3a]QMU71620.1 ABC transporter substrate-binding protein [Streptacidiphilus sp. P02-A3a]